jgi:hypothetical protein
MSAYVVRAFVQLREMLSSNRELARRFAQLETRLDKKLTETARAIGAILSAIRELMDRKPSFLNAAEAQTLPSPSQLEST